MKKILIALLSITIITNLNANPKTDIPSKLSPKASDLIKKASSRQNCNSLALHCCSVGAAIATSAVPIAIYYFVKQYEQERA